MKVLILGFVLTSCSTLSPTGGGFKTFDPSAKKECQDICKQADMTFQALVVVGGMAGCVCQNRGVKASASESGVMGGAVATMIAQQAAKQQSAQK